MLIEIAAFLVVFLFCWYINFRPRSANQLRPAYSVHHSPQRVPPCDYVIVGAGAAGLTAAATLLKSTSDDVNVLLVEKGSDAQPASWWSLLLHAWRRDRLLSFAPDLVKVPAEALPRGAHPTFMGFPTADEGFLAQRPWHFSNAEEVVASPSGGDAPSSASSTTATAAGIAEATAATAKANRYRLLQYAPFPRGCGVGGTSLVDWGMHLNSIWPATGVEGEHVSSTPSTVSLWARLPVQFPAIRNPLSWSFAETVKGTALATPHLPTPAAPVRPGTVYPSYLYLDQDGRRLSMPSAILGDEAPTVLSRRLHVLAGYTVVDATLSSSHDDNRENAGTSPQRRARVTGVCVSRTGSEASATTISVTKGLIVAAGPVHSPRLLHRILSQHTLQLLRPLPIAVNMRDALAIPLIFPALPAVSADAVNARDIKATATWWMTQRGPYLTPLADTIASLRLPHIGPQVELRVVLLPFGGRDAIRFKSMGWDTVLATPLQAFTMLLVVQGLDGLAHGVGLANADAAPPGAPHARALCPHHTSPTALSDEVHRRVQEAFLIGMKECRRLTRENPLSSLTAEPGCESIDFTLLVPSDEGKAVRLAQLSRQLPVKRTARNRKELRELLLWARSVTAQEAYMHRYVDAHAYWLGYASGSSEAFLQSEGSFRVEGLENVIVGDNSAVTSRQWAEIGNRDALAAGSRSTSMDVAAMAAAELVRASERTK